MQPIIPHPMERNSIEKSIVGFIKKIGKLLDHTIKRLFSPTFEYQMLTQNLTKDIVNAKKIQMATAKGMNVQRLHPPATSLHQREISTVAQSQIDHTSLAKLEEMLENLNHLPRFLSNKEVKSIFKDMNDNVSKAELLTHITQLLQNDSQLDDNDDYRNRTRCLTIIANMPPHNRVTVAAIMNSMLSSSSNGGSPYTISRHLDAFSTILDKYLHNYNQNECDVALKQILTLMPLIRHCGMDKIEILKKFAAIDYYRYPNPSRDNINRENFLNCIVNWKEALGIEQVSPDTLLYIYHLTDSRQDVMNKTISLLRQIPNFPCTYDTSSLCSDWHFFYKSLLSLINQTPHNQRSAIIEAAVPRMSSVNNPADGMSILSELEVLRPIETSPPVNIRQNEYAMSVARTDLKDKPLTILKNLNDEFNKYTSLQLKIEFLNEAGVDAGGLGREFITELFAGLTKKMGFKQYQNGLHRPELVMDKNGLFQTLSDEDKKAYNRIGALIMFCLNVTINYPIGMIFDQGVFIALSKLQDEHLNCTLDDIIRNGTLFNDLFLIYAEMNSANEEDMKKIQFMKNALTPLVEETSDQMLMDTYAIVENYDEIQNLNINYSPSEIRKNYPLIQTAIRDYIAREMIFPSLAPLMEIVRGMQNAPFQNPHWKTVQNWGADFFSDQLQGKVSREMIIEKLRFKNVARKKQEWIKEWLKTTSDEKAFQFLFAMTGARALGTSSLIINNTGHKIYFHTCSNSVDFPLNSFETKDQLFAALDASITGVEKNTRS